MLSESELLEGCMQNNRLYQKRLYEKFSRKMFGVCMCYTHDRYEAENILQDGFIKVFEGIRNFKPTGSLEGWIRRIIVNTAIDYYRKIKKLQFTKVELEDAENSAQASVDPEELDNISVDELAALIQKLPEGSRVIFNLYVTEGYNHRQIAEILGISEGTSKSQYSRARMLLQNQLKKNENFEISRLFGSR
jgi:RNA polymerase sigma-70 factor (ECF subfamily)